MFYTLHISRCPIVWKNILNLKCVIFYYIICALKIWILASTARYGSTHFCRIRVEVVWGAPRIIFEGRNLPPTNYIRIGKGIYRRVRIRFRYRQNSLILRIYEQFTRNVPQKLQKKMSNFENIMLLLTESALHSRKYLLWRHAKEVRSVRHGVTTNIFRMDQTQG